jgi:uncharacterized membrane protein YedE/YeeE
VTAAALHAPAQRAGARALAVAFASGIVFAIGLGLAGMTRPSKAIGFLDPFGGHWDPSLALVMAAAIAVHLPVQRALRRRPGFVEPVPTCDGPTLGAGGPTLDARDATADRRLVAGALLFGLGWGLGGFCPGPAVASLVAAIPGVLVFVASMAAGMALFALVAPRLAGGAAATDDV